MPPKSIIFSPIYYAILLIDESAKIILTFDGTK